MKIESPWRARERLLIYGGYGAGKSRAVLSIAAAMPDSTFYVIDTDNAYDRMLDGAEFRSLTNVEVTSLQQSDFDGMANALQESINKAGKDDFVVFDLFHLTWDAAQEYWTDNVYGMEIDEYFLDVKKRRADESKEVDKGYVEVDWVTVKKIFARRIANPILNAKCHVIAVCGIKALTSKEDSDIRRDYSTFRGRPAGNKDSGHWFHSILIFEARDDGWVFSTVKDRERPKAEKEYFDNFAEDYLVTYAGWKNVSAPPKPATRRKSTNSDDKPDGAASA